MATNITIQNLDDAIAERISREAERRGISVDPLVLELIRKLEPGAKNRRWNPSIR